MGYTEDQRKSLEDLISKQNEKVNRIKGIMAKCDTIIGTLSDTRASLGAMSEQLGDQKDGLGNNKGNNVNSWKGQIDDIVGQIVSVKSTLDNTQNTVATARATLQIKYNIEASKLTDLQARLGEL